MTHTYRTLIEEHLRLWQAEGQKIIRGVDLCYDLSKNQIPLNTAYNLDWRFLFLLAVMELRGMTHVPHCEFAHYAMMANTPTEEDLEHWIQTCHPKLLEQNSLEDLVALYGNQESGLVGYLARHPSFYTRRILVHPGNQPSQPEEILDTLLSAEAHRALKEEYEKLDKEENPITLEDFKNEAAHATHDQWLHVIQAIKESRYDCTYVSTFDPLRMPKESTPGLNALNERQAMASNQLGYDFFPERTATGEVVLSMTVNFRILDTSDLVLRLPRLGLILHIIARMTEMLPGVLRVQINRSYMDRAGYPEKVLQQPELPEVVSLSIRDTFVPDLDHLRSSWFGVIGYQPGPLMLEDVHYW